MNSDENKCIHGGKIEECTGQCSKSISIETKHFKGILYCLLHKGHEGICHYEWEKNND